MCTITIQILKKNVQRIEVKGVGAEDEEVVCILYR